MRRALAFFALFLAVTAEAAPRQWIVARRDGAQAPAAWLWQNAYPLAATALPAPDYDLEPLRRMIGDAQIIGLGDGTHGTHEFYTSKLRIIDFLVRKMNVDVIAFEAPFTLFNQLDEYVQSGTGDPRALLIEADDRLGYRFWRVEEMLDVVEWMRDYNINRGIAPAVHIAGADMYDRAGSTAAVVAYLRPLDATAADEAHQQYSCSPSIECADQSRAVRETLEGRRAELEPRTGARAFNEAVQNARVAEQSIRSLVNRDQFMAVNTEWLLQYWSTSKRIVMWAHQEHIGKAPSDWVPGEKPMGAFLAEAVGDAYFTIGSLTGSGSVRQWVHQGGQPPEAVVTNVPEAVEGSYESYFRLRPAPALLVPLNGTLPEWLSKESRYFAAGVSPFQTESMVSLPAKVDAVIYIEHTTPTQPFE